MNILDNFIYLERLVKGKTLRKNIPLTISLSITGNCNFKCSFCYGGFGKHKKDHDVSTTEWFDLIEEAGKMGTKSIQLLGGEPLLRSDIEEIIDRIKKEKIICSMNSNGSCIEKRIDAVKKLDYITISLDGDKVSNDKNRGDGTYELIWKGVNCLLKNDIPFSVVCVLTKNNIQDVPKMLQLSKDMGFAIEFNLLCEQNNQTEIGSVSLSDREIKETLRMLNRYKDNGYLLSFSNQTRLYALDWPVSYNKKILYSESPENFKGVSCYMGRFMCYIEHQGMVYPCSQLIGQFPALNFREVGFKKAWENLIERRVCSACYSLCYNEMNLLHGLNIKVLSNTILRKFQQISLKKTVNFKGIQH